MDSLSEATGEYPSVASLCEGMASSQWGAISDAAQVIANYLRCHPKVESVRYPGLRCDPLFEEASHTLIGGFGPYVLFCAAGSWYSWTSGAEDPKLVIMQLEGMLSEL